MRIALVQAPMQWENIKANFQSFESKLLTIDSETDLVVLPEMFTSGFTMHPERVYITMEHSFISRLKEIAKEKDFAIVGSVVIQEGGKYYNRLLFIEPTGEVHQYDKRHLFSLAGEEKVYESGTQRIIVNYRGWRVCPLVCYDLRFPVYARNTGEVYDLLIYVASWPDQRIYAWDTIMKTRAIENMSYVVGVNRSGSDENDNVYSGHSQLVDYMGKYVIEPVEGDTVIYANLDLTKQQKARSRFGFLRDADEFTLDI